MNKLFKALNDATRRDILHLLRQRDMTAGEIAGHFAFSKPTISHHLELLKQAELVIAVRKGQFIYYSIHTTALDDLLRWIISITEKKSEP